jgi:hypothetical protein
MMTESGEGRAILIQIGPAFVVVYTEVGWGVVVQSMHERKGETKSNPILKDTDT